MKGIMKGYERPPPIMKGYERCSKILRIRWKNPMEWVVSNSRDYWIYVDITWKSSKNSEFWEKVPSIGTFFWSKFSPVTGEKRGARKAWWKQNYVISDVHRWRTARASHRPAGWGLLQCGWSDDACATTCLFVCLSVCCYKTLQSLLRLLPWPRGKPPGSISTRTV